LQALECADGETAFLGPDMAMRYRLLATPGLRLPMGFAVDDGNDENLSVSRLRWFAAQATREKWVGLNCSACHSGEVRLGATAVRIDGGPALFDYQSFVEDLDAALRATLAAGDTAPKWQRFAAAALGAKDTPANRLLLRAAAGKLLAWEDRVEAMNATPLRYGYGRVDAFGHIFNKIALFNGAASPTPNAADAPVSYPHIWDIYRHDKLQWNGIAENQRLKLGGARYLDYGALGRNTGEVLGEFGDVVVTPGGGLGGFKSSVQADNLIRMETLLTRLQAPKWPVAFGALDAAQVAADSRVFERDCISCHAPQPGTSPYQVKLIALTEGDSNSTDPWMACNAISYRSATGKLEGTPRSFIGGGEKFGAEAPVGRMLETTVKGTLVGKKARSSPKRRGYSLASTSRRAWYSRRPSM
jgi:cytochrome c5